MTSSAHRIDIRAEDVDRGLGRLVLSVLDLVRHLLERQALRRADSLASDDLERLGLALMALNERMEELRETFGVSRDDLSLPIEISDLHVPPEPGAER